MDDDFIVDFDASWYGGKFTIELSERGPGAHSINRVLTLAEIVELKEECESAISEFNLPDSNTVL